jgi:hypothetical protein
MRDGVNDTTACILTGARLRYISQHTLSLTTEMEGDECSCRVYPEHSGEFQGCTCNISASTGNNTLIMIIP